VPSALKKILDVFDNAVETIFFKNLFFMFLDHFDVVMLKIIFKI